MSVTTARRPEAIDAPAPARLPRVLLGVAAAVWAAVLGLAFLVCAVLAAWVSADHHDPSLRPALATAVQAWLLAHRDLLRLHAGGTIGIAPLGVTLGLYLVLDRCARWMARRSAVTDAAGALGVAGALAVPYGVTAALLTVAGKTPAVLPDPLAALGGGLALAFAAGLGGAFREAGCWPDLRDRFPASWRLTAAAAARTGVVLAVGAAGLVAAAAGLRFPAMVRTADQVGGGVGSGILLGLLSVAYLPNFLGWALGFAAGSGFAVGVGTTVAPGGVRLGPVPMLPPLGAIPESVSALAWCVLAIPLAAGAAGGWRLAENTLSRRVLLLRAAALAGALAMLAAAVAWLSGGSIGPGRMAVVGPSLFWTPLAVGAEVFAGAAAAGWLRSRQVA
ncbi:MAG: hypothetical protein IRZ27_01610 [Acidothermus cellulolyticus]|uniref:cell division protein PerM n=1 Tax=Acidothermus cellulolyticus TaxID=28049 RepID=UPI0002F34FB4|nr:DUF6350 family protein [Acidothermus cellulolyticus]MBX5447198.1 hypothetical protein [Acidothermus cellulolyticus]